MYNDVIAVALVVVVDTLILSLKPLVASIPVNPLKAVANNAMEKLKFFAKEILHNGYWWARDYDDLIF